MRQTPPWGVNMRPSVGGDITQSGSAANRIIEQIDPNNLGE